MHLGKMEGKELVGLGGKIWGKRACGAGGKEMEKSPVGLGEGAFSTQENKASAPGAWSRQVGELWPLERVNFVLDGRWVTRNRSLNTICMRPGPGQWGLPPVFTMKRSYFSDLTGVFKTFQIGWLKKKVRVF